MNTAFSNGELLNVVTTYLHIPHASAARLSYADHPDLNVIESILPSADFYRFLYATVGRDYAWTDRLPWTDDALVSHLARPENTLLILYLQGTPIGFVELDRGPNTDEPGTEIAYFGLMPFVHGRGFGKHLLSVGVGRAFADGAERVWVHTCTLDGPHALGNYVGRGFVPHRTIEHTQAVTPGF